MIAVYATKNKDNLNQDAPVAVAKGNAIVGERGARWVKSDFTLGKEFLEGIEARESTAPESLH
jgi:hypothetical protein